MRVVAVDQLQPSTSLIYTLHHAKSWRGRVKLNRANQSKVRWSNIFWVKWINSRASFSAWRERRRRYWSRQGSNGKSPRSESLCLNLQSHPQNVNGYCCCFEKNPNGGSGQWNQKVYEPRPRTSSNVITIGGLHKSSEVLTDMLNYLGKKSKWNISCLSFRI